MPRGAGGPEIVTHALLRGRRLRRACLQRDHDQPAPMHHQHVGESAFDAALNQLRPQRRVIQPSGALNAGPERVSRQRIIQKCRDLSLGPELTDQHLRVPLRDG